MQLDRSSGCKTFINGSWKSKTTSIPSRCLKATAEIRLEKNETDKEKMCNHVLCGDARWCILLENIWKSEKRGDKVSKGEQLCLASILNSCFTTWAIEQATNDDFGRQARISLTVQALSVSSFVCSSTFLRPCQFFLLYMLLAWMSQVCAWMNSRPVIVRPTFREDLFNRWSAILESWWMWLCIFLTKWQNGMQTKSRSQSICRT